MIFFLMLTTCLTAVFPADIAQDRRLSLPFALSREGTDAVITAVGDIMMPSSIQNAAARNGYCYASLFEKISGDLKGDITFANLETPVDDQTAISGYPRFNARPELLSALKHAGIGVVSTANNHALDAGPSGLKRTLDNIAKAGIVAVGTGRSRAEAQQARSLSAGGITAAFLAYTYGTNRGMPRRKKGMPYINILRAGSDEDLSQAAAAVGKARKTADLVLVSLHWGAEYRLDPAPWQRKAAAALIEAGADVILGHHPHVLQPVESYEARDGRIGVIAYSLGNFVSSQNRGITDSNWYHAEAFRGDGIILMLYVRRENGGSSIVRVEFLPIWTARERAGKAEVFRPVCIDRELSRLAGRAERTAEEGKMLTLLTRRRQVILNRLSAGAETPERP